MHVLIEKLAAPEQGFRAICLATNPKTRKVAELKRDNQVTLTYLDTTEMSYVSIAGQVRACGIFEADCFSDNLSDWDRTHDDLVKMRRTHDDLRIRGRKDAAMAKCVDSFLPTGRSPT